MIRCEIPKQKSANVLCELPGKWERCHKQLCIEFYCFCLFPSVTCSSVCQPIQHLPTPCDVTVFQQFTLSHFTSSLFLLSFICFALNIFILFTSHDTPQFASPHSFDFTEDNPLLEYTSPFLIHTSLALWTFSLQFLAFLIPFDIFYHIAIISFLTVA